jgi:fido (protein-threonine AMPylation protein)
MLLKDFKDSLELTERVSKRTFLPSSANQKGKMAMSFYQDEEYEELLPNGDAEKRKEYWDVAKGLQKTDGLETSEYLETVIADTLNDTYGTQEAEKKISKYYEDVDPDSPKYQHKEADIVASRITLILERGGFKFSPSTLCAIHEELFQDVLPYKWVGTYRTTNITKSEVILNGRSVQYADYNSIQSTLKYDFEEEKASRYTIPFTSDQISTFSNFISNIWQTHPFREGNTRTIAVFLILYLRNIGIEVGNEAFRDHALYFRNALVRSNYADIKAGIYADATYLQLFFENVLTGADHSLEEQAQICKALFS